MGNPRAQVEITASTNKLTDALRAARSKFASFASGVGKGFKGILSHPAVASSLGNIAGDIARRGLDALTNQASAVMDFEKALVRLRINARMTPEAMNEMRTAVRAVSRETAIADSEILNGARTYVDLTGDIEGAKSAMSAFARVAQASGSTVSDVARASASMQQAMGLSATDIEAAFAGMIEQGKSGAVALNDFAGEMATIAPKFAMFKGGKGLGGIGEFGAAFQVIMRGSGNASEAATKFDSLMGAIIMKSKKLGVNVFEKGPGGVKQLRNFADIINDISNSKIARDPAKLVKAFGRKEAFEAYKQLADNKELFGQLIDEAGAAGDVHKDLADYLASSSGRMEIAWNNLKLTIAEALTPERINAFVGGVEMLAQKLGPVVDGISKIAGVASDVGGALFDAGANARDFLNGGASGAYIDAMYPNESFGIQDMDERHMRILKEGQDFAKARGGLIANKVFTGDKSQEQVDSENVAKALQYYYAGSNKGERMAGLEYLKTVGLDPNAKKVTDTLDKIAANTAAGTQVKVGDQAVVKADRKSGAHHTRTE